MACEIEWRIALIDNRAFQSMRRLFLRYGPVHASTEHAPARDTAPDLFLPNTFTPRLRLPAVGNHEEKACEGQLGSGPTSVQVRDAEWLYSQLMAQIFSDKGIRSISADDN